MKLQSREKRTIIIGLTIAAVVLGYTRIIRPLTSSARETSVAAEGKRGLFVEAARRLRQHETVSVQMKKLTEELHIEVPTDSPTDQLKRLVENLESLAGRSAVQIRNVMQLKSQARATAARGTHLTELKLDLTCKSFASLARFVDGLEQSKVPIVVDQMSITASGGQSPGSGAPSGPTEGSNTTMPPQFKGPAAMSGSGMPPEMARRSSRGRERQLQVALKIYTYLFPERAQQ